MSQVRKRKLERVAAGGDKKADVVADDDEPVVDDARQQQGRLSDELQPGTYWLTRVVFLRALGVIYLVAFYVSFGQNKELMGDNGLLPVKNYMEMGESDLWVACDTTRPSMTLEG